MRKLWYVLGASLVVACGMVPPPVAAQNIINENGASFSTGEFAQSATITTSAITACGQTLHANTVYTLAGNIGSNPLSRCLTIVGPGLKINLNGHTITGTLKGAGINHNGIRIYNGKITCLDYDATMPGCLYIGSDAAGFTAPIEIDHLAIHNTGTSNTNSERNLMLDFGSVAKNSVTGPNVKIHDITSVSAVGLRSSRIVNLQVQGTAHKNAAFAEFYNNHTTCVADAAACQGIVAYGLFNTKVHNNTVTNQLSNPTSTETARGILCDQTDGCEIYANTVDAKDGRAVRLRGTSKKNGANSVHGNVIKNVVAGSNPNYVAALHIGDPDSGSEVENATITKNQIYVTTGRVLMVRAATGVTLTDNQLYGNGAVNLLDLRYGGSGTSASVMRTSITGGSASSFCESGTSGNLCQSGNASGVCRVNNSGC